MARRQNRPPGSHTKLTRGSGVDACTTGHGGYNCFRFGGITAMSLLKSMQPIVCSIAPWLSVRNGAGAGEVYKSAFGAIEIYRVEDSTGSVVSRLAVDGAEFWLSDESPAHGNFSPESLGGGSVKMLLTVPDPDGMFAKAVAAGAKEVYAVSEG